MSKMSEDVAAELERLRHEASNDPEIPELVRSFLIGGARLDALRLDARGRWSFNGTPVEHPRVVALFSRSLRRTSSGTWVLVIPPYTYPVLVDGVGSFIDRLRGDVPEGRLGTGAWVDLALATLETDGDEYLGVRLESRPARLVASAYQDMLAHLDQDSEGWLIRWRGREHRVPERAIS